MMDFFCNTSSFRAKKRKENTHLLEVRPHTRQYDREPYRHDEGSDIHDVVGTAPGSPLLWRLQHFRRLILSPKHVN